MYKGLLVVGRGIGQVMFQGNALSGLLMLIGIACSSWNLALLALAGNIASTLAAYLLGYSREDIRKGLYGFNGTLVGIAIGVFMRINIWSISLLLMGSALSSGIAQQFNRQNKLPGYTAPFILSVWILLILCRYLFPSLMLPPVVTPPEHVPNLLYAFNVSRQYVNRAILSFRHLIKLTLKRSLHNMGCIAAIGNDITTGDKHR